MLRKERCRGGEGDEARGREDHRQHLVKDLLALEKPVTRGICWKHHFDAKTCKNAQVSIAAIVLCQLKLETKCEVRFNLVHHREDQA